ATRSQNNSLDTAPVTGTRRALVLLVDFSDKAATQNQAHFDNLMFTLGSNSMRDFYREASYNQLDVIGEVSGQGGVTAGWYRAPRAKSYYTNNDYGFGSYPQNAQKLVEDVVDMAAPHVNFANYDNTGNGVVDALVIICAGTGAEASGNKNDIWSHKWSINPKTVDGVKVISYFMAPEDGRVGVMAHELGHLLMGWPDLYDTDYSSRGTGRWDLMAGGSWNNGGNTPAHPTAWCKVRAGWVTPQVILNAEQNVSIAPYANSGAVIKCPIGASNSKEYFLLSNRKQAGFDAHLPGEGLIIEHIDENRTNNSDENHYLVDIEQADGLRELNKNIDSGDADDAFPNGGKTSFTQSTTPNSNDYNGNDSKVSVTNIAKSGNNITATVNVGGAQAQVWKHNVAVLRTFTSYHSKNCWAYLQGEGWRKIDPLTEDGVTNCFAMLCEAAANAKTVSVLIDGSNLYQIYL
ncbi:MAG: M6 family metalloprotease domain-containing protein, partial [Gammaproteobacteria bacterium]